MVISIDDLAIPRRAREAAPAHAFVKFLYEPAVILSPKLATKSKILADLGTASALYIRIWDEIKAAK